MLCDMIRNTTTRERINVSTKPKKARRARRSDVSSWDGDSGLTRVQTRVTQRVAQALQGFVVELRPRASRHRGACWPTCHTGKGSTDSGSHRACPLPK